MREERPTPKVGDFLKPDGWGKFAGEILQEDDGFKDSLFPGCQFRLPSQVAPDCQFAVNVKVTGRVERKVNGSWGWWRVEVEFVGDGEESTFCGGWLHPNSETQRNWKW